MYAKYIAILALVISLGLVGLVYAYYDDHPGTALTDPNVVCGNHLCAASEKHYPPKEITPVKGH